jgi:hypothetical protein
LEGFPHHLAPLWRGFFVHARRHRIQVSKGDAEALRYEMLNLAFNAFGITLTAAAVYGAMDGQIIDPIGFGCAAVAVALFANFVEARTI